MGNYSLACLRMCRASHKLMWQYWESRASCAGQPGSEGKSPGSVQTHSVRCTCPSGRAKVNKARHLRALRGDRRCLPAQLGLAARHLRRQLAQARQLSVLPRHLRRASCWVIYIAWLPEACTSTTPSPTCCHMHARCTPLL